MGCVTMTKRPIVVSNGGEESKFLHEEKKLGESSIDLEVSKSVVSRPRSKIKISTSKMIKFHFKDQFNDNYKMISKIGKGAFGCVYKVFSIKDDKIRAMKVIKKENILFQDDEKTFLKEIEILIKTDHPHIIKIFEYFIDEVNFYLITEYVSGGALYDVITSWKVFDEGKAASVMYQLLSAVNYLHSLGIVHRDIKPENILVEGGEKNGCGSTLSVSYGNLTSEKSLQCQKNESPESLIIKLIDFGTCNYFSSKKLTLKVGTPYYIAPEVLERKYDQKVDIWSCGVILYILLCGHPPFYGSSTKKILDAVKRGEFLMKGREWEHASKEAKALVKKMLERNPEKRISATEAMHDPWIINSYKKGRTIDEKCYANVMKNIQSFNAKEKFQQATLAYIVHFFYSSNEIDGLRKIFHELDKNGDGRLTYQELKQGFDKIFGNKVTEIQFNEIFQEVDQDQNGFIEYQEFLRVGLNKKAVLSEDNLKLAFGKMDQNHDGKLSTEELKNVLGTSDNDYIVEILREFDVNKKDEITYPEFLEFMKKCLISTSNQNTPRRTIIAICPEEDKTMKNLSSE